MSVAKVLLLQLRLVFACRGKLPAEAHRIIIAWFAWYHRNK
jgi:hypothetical protein